MIKVWKHHIAESFERNPSLVEGNGAGKGGTVFTDYEKMKEWISRNDSRKFYAAPIMVELEDLDFNFPEPYMATMKKYVASCDNFKPLDE